MARNYFQSPFETGQDAFDRGFDRQQAITDRITTTRAGGKLAAGDRRGAAATFAQGGMIAPARQMQADQQAEEDRQYDRETATQDRQTKMKAQQAQALIKIAEGLRTVPVGSRAAALQQALPIFEQIGVDPAMFASLTEDQLSDDQLGLFAGEMEKQYQIINRGSGGYDVMDMRTGKKVGGVEPDPKLQAVAGGATLYDPETRQPVYTAPKTFAPPRPRSGGSSGGGAPSPQAGGKPWERKW
jgi:hypothetical protein